MKPPLKDRVRTRMNQIGRNAAQVTKLGELKRTFVYDVLEGKVGNVRGDNARKLAKGLDCDVAYLIGAQDAPDVGPGLGGFAEEQSHFDSVSSVRPYQARSTGGMPVIDVTAGAGPGGIALYGYVEHEGDVYSGDAVRGEVVLPDFMIAGLTHANPSFINWLDVRGDSMEETLSGGDWVAVNIRDTAIGQGGVFALRDPEGEVIVKRLKKARGKKLDQVEIISDNPKQGSDTVAADTIHVLGRVIGRLTRIG